METIDTTADRLLAHRRACPSCRADLPDEIGPARAAAHYALVEHAAGHLLDGEAGIDTGNAVSAGAGIAAVDGASRSATGADATHGHRGARGDDSSTPTSGRTRGRRGGAKHRGRGSRRGELQVVIDLATLLGLAEHPGLVAGEPVPAAIARELAGECGSLRRVVTDPVTGYLLDYGRRVYLPAALARFVPPRDGTCRSPGCAQPAWRCQLDHREPFPRGPSSAGNMGALCKRDHDTKHAGGWTVTRRDPDGTVHWTTRDGQTGTTPPRPYLNHPADDTPPVPPDDPADEQPPY